MTPRLSIVIPTHNRPELLPRAIDSVLAQTVPVKLIVSDDGNDDDSARTTAVLAEKFDLPLTTGHIEHVRTHGKGAWANWKAGIEYACDRGAELACWLQDDDVILPHYATRVIQAFDRHPRANVWEGRCQISPDGKLFLWYKSNGPFIPMEAGAACSWTEGSILASTAYFTSHSLAPGFAFRNTPQFRRALDLMPDGCDIFVERLIPALAANGGPWISDPIVAGYWIQHPDQLSRQQHPDQPRQTGLFVDALDAFMETLPTEPHTWQQSLAEWCCLIPADQILSFMSQLDQTKKESGRKSPCFGPIGLILARSLRGRVEVGYKQSMDTNAYWKSILPADPHKQHIDELRDRITDPLRQIRRVQNLAG